MSCFSPSYVQRKYSKVTGEVETKWLGRIDHSQEKELLHRDYGGFKTVNGSYIDIGSNGRLGAIEMIQVPCGKCIGCRIDYSRSWADRMTYHVIGKEDSSWFITLTYNDEFLDTQPFNSLYGLSSLNYAHMDEFIKKLRNKYRDCQLDYYYAGEYGDSNFRPHYHMILYNCPLDDLTFFKCNDNGDPIYISDILNNLWENKGFVTVSPFSWHGAAYTASYVEKKRDGRKLCEYTALDIEPEKARMSRRPGLAYEYYLEHYKDLWKNNGLSVSRSVNAKGHLGLPRYFRKLAVDKGIGFENFLDYQRRSVDRINVVNPFNVENSSFDLDRVADMLKFEERELLSRSKNKLI